MWKGEGGDRREEERKWEVHLSSVGGEERDKQKGKELKVDEEKTNQRRGKWMGTYGCCLLERQ